MMLEHSLWNERMSFIYQEPWYFLWHLMHIIIIYHTGNSPLTDDVNGNTRFLETVGASWMTCQQAICLRNARNIMIWYAMAHTLSDSRPIYHEIVIILYTFIAT